ncbi:MAG: DUF2892 domain-containing protein [Ignavibacteria bacterium]|jgi:hypothetical protein|nr:DUF2892 domain-containing protein [Ignavibacteria bacterium]MCU7503024.1 DUF2892 domain-containing protein [Ignavibacteria bacterium]MCU7516556.1 DUF2892 domain-containing protein [Ignavibacteria bacterium]
MKTNLGKLDRIIRSAAGFTAIAAGFTFQSWWGLIGVALLLTGVTAWCPLYAALGINTLDETHPQKV